MKLFGLHLPSFRWKPRPDPVAQVLELLATIEAGDVQAVRELLARGYPKSHRNLRDKSAAHSAYLTGNPDMMAAVIEGDITMDLGALMYAAALSGNDAMAIRMLEMGVKPLHVEQSLPESAAILLFKSDLPFSLARGSRDWAAALSTHLPRLPQAEKDQALAWYVGNGDALGVRALLDAGANAAQLVDGRPLLHIVKPDAEDVKRMLRAVQSGAILESAMGSDDGQLPAPPAPSPTL